MKKILGFAAQFSKWLENTFQFIAVIMLLYLLLFTLYMMFSVANSNALDFLSPLVNIVISISGLIWKDASGILSIWGFITGLLLIIFLFLISQFLKQRFNILSKTFSDMKINYLKEEEKRINKELHKEIESMNKKISACVIYLEIKAKDSVKNKVNIEEQYKLLNQFLYSKTQIIPEKSGYGYVYKFSNIEKIDNYIEYFLKVINSSAPIDYLCILQVIETTYSNAVYDIEKIRNAGIYNKILLNPTTNLRYEHNAVQQYSTGVVGDYVFAGETHSIYELKEKTFNC